ncbi:MAG: hypothetical protein IJN66_04605 [Muribaculaceae bacterium]|nr:hypothetical protein [Muribaculaceae bacterium]
MRKYLLTLVAVACLTSHAQIAQVNSTEPLLRGVENEMFYPVLNQDGTKLLFTSANCQGLKMYDFNNDVTIKISEAERAGLDASFSADGKEVYYITQVQKEGKNMRQAKKFDLASKQEVAISSEGRLVARPVAVKGGVITSVDGRVISPVSLKTAVRVQGTKLFITKNGVEKSYTPIEKSAGYLWASLSPDETKVMFFAAGRGIVITDLNGTIVAELGNYESPVWFGNNHVVAMNAKHNGYQNISSQILIMNVDGTQIQELTKPESMTMNPTASFDAGKIVYNTIDGRLYQMNISLK